MHATKQTLYVVLIVFIAAIGCSVASSSALLTTDISPAERTSVTSITIDEVDLDLHVAESNDQNEVEKATAQGDSLRHLQRYLPYCRSINVAIECTNMKNGKECRDDIVPWNSNSCYIYLKYRIAVSNAGNDNAKIRGLTTQQNGSEKSYLGMIGDGFVLQPRMRITISRTEWLNRCEDDIIRTGAEVLADVSEEATCANHDFYIISGGE